jgi:hypothetical protein
MPPVRKTLLGGLVVASLATGALTALPVQAVTGPETADQSLAFTARLEIGDGERACSGVLVESQWLLTSAACVSPDGTPAAGAPAEAIQATIGRTDLTTTAGAVRNVVQLVPYAGRDVVLARLDQAVHGIAPVAIAAQPPAAGSTVTVAGYGRTTSEWVPLKLHTGTFTAGSASGADLPLGGQNGATICAGDAGGPALATTGGKTELVGIGSRSWQGGCFGTDAAQTNTDALDSRVDDLAAWVSAHVARWGLRSEANGKYVSAEFGYTGGTRGELRARTDAPAGSWEQFSLNSGGSDGSVSLRSQNDDLYVSVETEEDSTHLGMLRARSATAYGWEKFLLERQSNGNYALKSVHNGKYVSTELNYTGADADLLRARSDKVSGSWERFTFTRTDDFPTASRDTVQPGPLPTS